MNTSLIHVCDCTLDARVKHFAEFLIDNRNKRMRVAFTKKNGERRDMVIVPKNEYNDIMGIETTAAGRKIVASKANNDIITVVELCADGRMQPRSINLRTIVSVELA